MKSHLFVKNFFTSFVAIAFVFVSVMTPTRAIAIETGAGSPFDVESATAGMTGWQDLAGIAMTCALAPALTEGISYVTQSITGIFSSKEGAPPLAGLPVVGGTAAFVSGTDASLQGDVSKEAAVGAIFTAGEASAAANLTATGAVLANAAAIAATVPTNDAISSTQLGAISTQLTAMQSAQAAIASIGASQKKKDAVSNSFSDCLVYNAGQMMLKQLTENTVVWIQGGFHGSPSFTIDTHKTFLDLADMVAGDLARELRGIAMCDFRVNFKNDLANTVELSAKREYKFAGKTKCPFPETLNLSSSDFYKGVNKWSWAGMEYAMQENGNPFGIALLTGEELAARSSEKKEVRQQELSWSNGFTSIVDTENCNYPEGVDIEDVYIDGSGAVYTDAQKREFQKTFCKTTTPGKMLGDQLTEATGVDMQRLGLVDSVNKIVAVLIDQITKKAAEGIFCAVSREAGCDNEIPTNYVTVQEKKAETIAMENAAIKPYFDAWQAEIKKDKDAQEELVRLQEELADAEEQYAKDGTMLSEVARLKREIEEQEVIIATAPDRIATAKAAYDDAASVDLSLRRQQELQAAQAEVDAAKSVVQTAENTAIRAQEAYYKALMTDPNSANIAGLKQMMEEANAVLARAQADLQIANERLYTAQHPAYVAPSQ